MQLYLFTLAAVAALVAVVGTAPPMDAPAWWVAARRIVRLTPSWAWHSVVLYGGMLGRPPYSWGRVRLLWTLARFTFAHTAPWCPDATQNLELLAAVGEICLRAKHAERRAAEQAATDAD